MKLTVAGVVSGIAPVVKLQTKLLASGLPAKSVAAVVIVAVKSVFGAKSLFGVNVAVVPAYVTVPGTTVLPGPCNKKLAVVMVVAFIASLKVAVIC